MYDTYFRFQSSRGNFNSEHVLVRSGRNEQRHERSSRGWRTDDCAPVHTGHEIKNIVHFLISTKSWSPKADLKILISWSSLCSLNLDFLIFIQFFKKWLQVQRKWYFKSLCYIESSKKFVYKFGLQSTLNNYSNMATKSVKLL